MAENPWLCYRPDGPGTSPRNEDFRRSIIFTHLMIVFDVPLPLDWWNGPNNPMLTEPVGQRSLPQMHEIALTSLALHQNSMKIILPHGQAKISIAYKAGTPSFCQQSV